MPREPKKNPKIKGGYVDIGLSDEDILNERLYKMRVTTFLDGDILEWLKRLALQGKGKGRYQTLLNDILRSAMNEHMNVKAVLTKTNGDVVKLTHKQIKKLEDILK